MKNTWRHDLFEPHQFAKRKGYYYDFKNYKIYKSFIEEQSNRLKSKIHLSKIERYFCDNGYKRTGTSMFSCVADNGLYRYYSKDDFILFYGMFLFGNPLHLWIPYELIKLNNIEHLCTDKIGICEIQHQLMMRIEQNISSEIIEQALIKKNIYFSFDGVTDEIKIVKCKEIDKLSLPDGIVFVLEAKRQNIKVV